MGSWGVTAHESDYGLDLLAVVMDEYLQKINYGYFDLKAITELLRTHIMDEFSKENGNGLKRIGADGAQKYIDFFNDYTFPYRYAHAVMLIAECFAEYRKTGKLSVRDYNTKKKRQVSKFIFTTGGLETMLTDLKALLSPEHPLYQSWFHDCLDEWQRHIEKLCDVVAQAINEGGDSHA